MSKFGGVLVIVLSLIAGFGGGWVYQSFYGNQATSATTQPATTTTTAKTKTLAQCLTEVWGKDKYAAITANPALATTDDNLASLKCYKQ